MRPNISQSGPSRPGSQSYGCDVVTKHRDLTALRYNAELFQNVIVHERPVEKGRHPSIALHASLDLVQRSLGFPQPKQSAQGPRSSKRQSLENRGSRWQQGYRRRSLNVKWGKTGVPKGTIVEPMSPGRTVERPET